MQKQIDELLLISSQNCKKKPTNCHLYPISNNPSSQSKFSNTVFVNGQHFIKSRYTLEMAVKIILKKSKKSNENDTRIVHRGTVYLSKK